MKIDLQNLIDSDEALAAGDLNGDGHTDLAVLANDGVFILRQQADGAFATPDKFYSGAEGLQRSSLPMWTATAGATWRCSCADAEYPVRVRFQSADGRLGPECRYKLPAPELPDIRLLGGRSSTPCPSRARAAGCNCRR